MAKKNNEKDVKDKGQTTLAIPFQFDIRTWLEIIVAVLTIGGAIFTFGYWVAGIEHKVEIMNLNQKHNNEISELRIQMNNQIQAIQNKYDILEANYNALKDRKEATNGK